MFGVDFYANVDFGKTVYVVDFDSRKITEDTLKSLVLDAVEHPTVVVVGKSLHCLDGREKGDKISDFESEEEAYHAFLMCGLWDLDNNDDMPCYRQTHEQAEAVLEER